MPASSFQPSTLLQLEVSGERTSRWPVALRFVYVTEKPLPGEPGKTAGDTVIEKKAGQTLVWVSLGKESSATEETCRKAGGAAAKWLINAAASDAEFDLDAIPGVAEKPQFMNAILEGLVLGAYRFDRYKEKDSPSSVTTLHLQTADVDGSSLVVKTVATVCTQVLYAREVGHQPANMINPISLAEEAAIIAGEYGLKLTVLDDTELEKMGAGAIVAVGKGSQTPSRLIVLEYAGKPGFEQEKPLVLLGKALTFDSGGYSLKDSTNIQGMKYDKCGGVTVLATMAAIAQLGLNKPVIGVIGASENMVSAVAYRPDDIITTLSGKTVEIVSTDAEGRLVLADSLTYIQKNYQPAAIIDLATLTGGVVVALGRIRAGLMSNNAQLTADLMAAGEKTGERLWQLPLDEDYLQATKGDDADLKNSGGREGHAILGGIFLKQFVSDDVPWAHLDIAGVADSPKDLPYSPKGATGFGVRLLIEYLQNRD